MEKQKNNTTKWLLGILLLIALVIWVVVFQKPDNYLHAYFLNVGQGDSEYVRTMNNYDVLIDGGPDKSVLSQLGEIMPFWDKKIDLVILTHPHSDHVSGLIEVLKRYEVGEIITTDAAASSAEYNEWNKIIKDKNIPTKIAKCNEEKNIDEKTKMFFLWPCESFKDQKIDNLNNTSIVFKLTYVKFSVLFTGDAQEEVQKELVNSNLTLKQLDNINILKVAHHGSSNGSLESFLKIINPDVAVISVGKDNKYGHPAQSTLDKLKNIGAEIFRTDKNGRIEIISNGQTFWTNTQE